MVTLFYLEDEQVAITGVAEMPLVFPTPEEMAAWPAPNYVDPVTRRPLLLGIEIPLFILVVLFNAMRLYR